MNLSGKQKNHLRGLAHALNPVVSIGNKGLTESVAAEVELALAQHELIKIKLGACYKDLTMVESLQVWFKPFLLSFITFDPVVFILGHED